MKYGDGRPANSMFGAVEVRRSRRPAAPSPRKDDRDERETETSIMRRCGVVNEATGSECRLPEGPHLSHAADSNDIWDNPEAITAYERRPQKRNTNTKYRKNITPKPTKDTRDRLSAMAERTDPESHAGIPAHAAEAWSKDAWVQETASVLREYLKANPREEWTSPEDIWPLIDAPATRDMRSMAMVIQSALRRGWIEEVGARRLRDTYRTRDGVSFQMNKLVPVYRSALG